MTCHGAMTALKAKQITRCLICGEGMIAAGIHFYRIKVEQFILDMNALRRAVGLEMQLGALASVMGPDENLANGIGETAACICAKCAMTASFGTVLGCLSETSKPTVNHEAAQ